jgi:hypothetical protein
MAENSLNQKKKSNTADKDINDDLSGQLDATENLTQDREQTLIIVAKRKKQKDDEWSSNDMAVYALRQRVRLRTQRHLPD